jgi:uncharacterized protein
MTLFQQIQQRKTRIVEIAERHHACNVRVFGSVARGQEQLQSDVDLLVEFLPGATLVDQFSLIDALSTELGRRVDVVSERALNAHIKQRVVSEAIAL